MSTEAERKARSNLQHRDRTCLRSGKPACSSDRRSGDQNRSPNHQEKESLQIWFITIKQPKKPNQTTMRTQPLSLPTPAGDPAEGRGREAAEFNVPEDELPHRLL